MDSSICTHLKHAPRIHEEAWIAPGAVVLGDVEIGKNSSVWYQTVIRADIEAVRIGEGTNIQDGSVIHLASDIGVTVGNYVTVGHKAMLHACEVGDEVLVGMGAILMDGVVIGERSIIAAGSLIPGGTRVPAGSLVMGTPGRVVKTLSEEEQKSIRGWAEKYVKVKEEHRQFQEAKSES